MNDHMLDLRPLANFQNPFHAAADLMAPQASQHGQQGEEAIAFLRALGDATPAVLTADPVMILVAGRIGLNAEQRGVLRHLCDQVDRFISDNS